MKPQRFSTQTPQAARWPHPTVRSANADLGIRPYLFDRRDHILVRIINDVMTSGRELAYHRRMYYGYFHPHGIKEMAESRSLRMAYAMVHLLTSLAVGRMDDRLKALRLLHAEVLDTAEGPLPKNTARVLLQIMKEMVRARNKPLYQLQLAHDFRITASGKPRRVRRQLRRYHLLEMPEEWNQITFDDHVHDANTKGRKSSTHLIMDAWIKGIRRLRVVHYNFIEPRFAAELLEAARIMHIDVRIGIEFYARFRDKSINLIWVPRGFADAQAFLCFLEEPAVAQLMRDGREASAHQQKKVMKTLSSFNQKLRQDLSDHLKVDIPPVEVAAFVDFVGIGQTSMLHLEKFVQQHVLEALQGKAEEMREVHASAKPEARQPIQEWFEKMNRLDLEKVVSDFLPQANMEFSHPPLPEGKDSTLPTLLQQSPTELLNRLASLQSGYRITLNLSNLEVADVLELIYDSNGMISRLELFNLKDWADDNTAHIPAINQLQEAVNSQNPLQLKRVILEIIHNTKEHAQEGNTQRLIKLKTILHDIGTLMAMHRTKPLKARLGSDSTGRSPRFHGMGMAVMETLPRTTRKQIIRDIQSGRERLPIQITVYKRHTFIRFENENDRQRQFPFKWLNRYRKVDWEVQSDETRMVPDGNVITLGGVDRRIDNHISLDPVCAPPQPQKIPLKYINSHLRNLIKVIVGFIPAFTTFYLTKDWWLLSYFGALIWFGITGIRNILQSVLGGGGLRRSPLLRWNAYVSWDRIADSLLFTGFSVPLLDYITKTVVLERIFNVTVATHPVLLYTVMALTNGIYLSTHNAFRGLPKAAIYGNFFRSALSIPVAIGLNLFVGHLLTACNVAGVSVILQKWAAIISKTASDVMAGIIEGSVDRYDNIRIRYRTYRKKLSELMDIYTQLELLYPESEHYDLMSTCQRPSSDKNSEAQDLERIIMIHSLDLLYFWMYQPRARSALHHLMAHITEEEKHLLISSQFTLLNQREISQMFVDGILGEDFGRALAFYLSRYPEYLDAIKDYA